MSRPLFRSACAALWGPQYRSEAARQLDVSLRTLMRYDAGERDVPAALLVRLAKLLRQRQAYAGRIADAIDDRAARA